VTTALVVYESMFGATRRAAQAIADGLEPYATVRLLEVSDAPRVIPEDVGLVIVGGPTHVFGLSRPNTRAEAAGRTSAPLVSPGDGVREWLEGLQGHEGLAGAAFGTRVPRRGVPGSAARGIAHRLRRRQVQLLAKAEDLFVGGVGGGLLDGEADRAREWAGRIGASLASSAGAGR
jgi:hypothetical protein